MSKKIAYEVVVIGSSWGGLKALSVLLARLNGDFPLPILIVQHQHRNSAGLLAGILKERTLLNVVEAEEKDSIKPGNIYIAPAGYHLLIESDKTVSLSNDDLVNYSRPSVDVLFESAAEVYREKTIGVVLTGANNDGAQGMKRIKQFGGLAMVQNPKTAEADSMPRAAIKTADVDYIATLEDIADLLIKYSSGPKI